VEPSRDRAQVIDRYRVIHCKSVIQWAALFKTGKSGHLTVDFDAVCADSVWSE